MSGSSVPEVHAAARARVRRHVVEGARRVVVWGPRGSGRTTLLDGLRADAVHDGERSPVRVVDAADLAEARGALAQVAPGETVIVGAPGRLGLDADAYVELSPLPPDEAEAWLAWRLRCDGVAADAGEVRSLVAHADGLPGGLARAATLLRLMPPAELVRACVSAERALAERAQIGAHPLFGAPRPLDLADRPRSVATLLLVACEPVSREWIEALAPGALDALLALRDLGLLRHAPDVALTHAAAWSLAAHPRFEADFHEAAARVDGRLVVQAAAARERWCARGDETALAEIGAAEARLARAVERAAGAATRGDDAARARLVAAALALQARAEVQVGPRPSEALERAFEAVGGADPELAIVRARALRLAGDVAAFELAHAAVDPAPLAPRLAALWHAERAHGQRLRRALDEAEASLERALVLAAEGQRVLEGARYTIDLGGLRYWQQRFPEAITLYDRGRNIAAQLGARRVEAIALSNLCLCHSIAGDEAAAERAGRAAVARLEAVGDGGALGTTLGHLGILAYQYGRLDDAERDLVEAEARVAAAGYHEQQVFVRFNLACVALAAGRHEVAGERLASLPDLLAASPSPYVAMHVERLTAELAEAQGHLADSGAALERGLALAQRHGSLEVEVQLAAQRARVLARLGEREGSLAAEARARASLERVPRPDLRVPCELALDHAAYLRTTGTPRAGLTAPALARLAEALRPALVGLHARVRIGASAADSGAVRQSANALLADLDRDTRVAVHWLARDPDQRAVCIDLVARRARLPGGAALDASVRRNAFRVLHALVEAGDAGIARDRLVVEVWPGERMRDDAASNRLHNALAQLRALGLADFVQRDGAKYQLAGVPTIVTDA